MGDMKEFFEPYKEMHKRRVEKNPQRLEYAVKLLTDNGITFKVCNETTGQINCYFANGKCLTFYAGTGKIQGYKNLRGINNFVRLCKGEKINDTIHIKEGDDVLKHKKGNARQYLQNVLDRWTEFCKGHPNFALAIKEILAENEELKAENERLKERIENNNGYLQKYV